MATMWLPLLSLGATLELRGSESSINFEQTGAQLTARCPSCATPSPPIELKPSVLRMAPKSFFFPLSASDSVKLRLKDVALSCADAPGNVPCVLPFDDVDEANFYCNWHVSDPANAVTTGPVAASVSSRDGAEVNLTAIHEIPATCAASTCVAAQPRLIPTLDCPLPDVNTLLNGDGSIRLTLTYGAPSSGPISQYATDIPFVDGVQNSVSFSTSPPRPPTMPPPPPGAPPPPPPISPPPGTAVAWYKVTTGSTENDGTDIGVRFMPVYLGSTRSYSYTGYAQACVTDGFRSWWDGTGSDPKVIYDAASNVNLGGHDAIQNGLSPVMGGGTASSHGGGFVVSVSQMLDSLKSIQVPVGQHVIAMKHGHGASESASYVQFTINSAYTSFSGISSSSSSSIGYDIAFCACKLNEDCPEGYV